MNNKSTTLKNKKKQTVKKISAAAKAKTTPKKKQGKTKQNTEKAQNAALKRLGKGLKEISHLFLSSTKKTSAKAAEKTKRTAKPKVKKNTAAKKTVAAKAKKTAAAVTKKTKRPKVQKKTAKPLKKTTASKSKKAAVIVKKKTAKAAEKMSLKKSQVKKKKSPVKAKEVIKKPSKKTKVKGTITKSQRKVFNHLSDPKQFNYEFGGAIDFDKKGRIENINVAPGTMYEIDLPPDYEVQYHTHPDANVSPPSPTNVLYPSGYSDINSSAPANFAALIISSSVALRFPNPIFSPIEVLNKKVSWVKLVIFLRNDFTR